MYDSLLRAAILPTFGGAPLTGIKTSAVRSWVAGLCDRGLSASRVRQAYNLLGAMMNAAVADGLIVASPCTGIKLPRLPRPVLRSLSAEEVARLASEMPAPYGLLVDVLGYGGLRFGEAAALRRARCDFARNRLHVVESLTEVNGRLIFGTTKTHQDRHVVLPPSLVGELAVHLRERVGGEPDALVFTRANGSPLRYSGFLRRVWKPAAARAEVASATPHLLRHTAATLLLNEGASVKDVQTQLGHADGSVTLNIYSAVVEGRDDELAQRMDRIRQRGTASPEGHGEGTSALADDTSWTATHR